MPKISKKQEEKYQDLADCIRSDQVSAAQIVEHFKDVKFKEWYRKRYAHEKLDYDKANAVFVDHLNKKKDLHQLAKDNPNKTYKELEKMRDEQ